MPSISLSYGVASQVLSSSLDAIIDSALHDHRLVGAVVAVALDGELIYERAAGFADRESERIMQPSTIFRLASVSKPFVTAAAMALVAQGKIALDDPINPWLPEFRPYLANGAEVAISLRQLLSHQAGLGYRFDETSADGLYAQAGVSDGLDASTITLDENVRRLGTVPLLFEPGTQWHYSLAIDVAGLLIERIYGAPLPEALSALVSVPLGLQSTGFFVDPEADLATPYVNNAATPHLLAEGETVPMEGSNSIGVTFSPSRIFDKNAFPSGGAGMAGTAKDVLLLLEALRQDKGDFLPQELVAEMRQDQTNGKDLADNPGFGFGLGFSVLRIPELSESPLAAGSWRWGGVYGHSWFVDPARKVSVVGLTNTLYEGMSGQFTQDLQKVVGRVVEKE